MKKMLLVCMMLSGMNIAASSLQGLGCCCFATTETVRYLTKNDELLIATLAGRPGVFKEKFQEKLAKKNQIITNFLNPYTCAAVGCCLTGNPEVAAMASCVGCALDCVEYQKTGFSKK